MLWTLVSELERQRELLIGRLRWPLGPVTAGARRALDRVYRRGGYRLQQVRDPPDRRGSHRHGGPTSTPRPQPLLDLRAAPGDHAIGDRTRFRKILRPANTPKRRLADPQKAAYVVDAKVLK